MSFLKYRFLLTPALTKLTTILFFTAAAYASPTVTVISPKSGTTAGSPVFYEAYATSSDCAAGIASMRIYSAPGVNAFTVNGAHIERFIALAPGTYNTVVQAWDNCGGVSKIAVDLSVSSEAGVSVYLPNQSSANWPVHVAASAANPACTQGIAAIRIYTASGVTPYTIDSNQLDAYVNLVPGSYDLTVQAWDNCGHVFKSQLSETVTAASDAYLYGAVTDGIGEFKINSSGTVSNPNAGGNPPTVSAQSASILGVDAGGWFVYASSDEGIYGFQINQSNGALVAIPGSPFPLNMTLGDQGPPTMVMDPTGNFIYLMYHGDGYDNEASLATYRIDRSSGSLTWTGWGHSFGDANTGCYSVLESSATNFTGQYLYLDVRDCSGSVRTYGLQADPNHGFLNNEVPGSPYAFGGWPASTADYLYVGSAEDNTRGEIFGASINPASGSLTQLSGSPFFAGSPDYPVTPIWADWDGRFLWAWEVQNQDTGLQPFAINSKTGDLASSASFQEFPKGSGINLAEDHTGQFVFTSIATNPGGVPPAPSVSQLASWTISSDGSLKRLNTLTLPNQLRSIAVMNTGSE